MALLFNAVERINPQTKEKKWYASPKISGKRTLKEISEDLSDVSSLSSGDVKSVISNMVDQIPKWLIEGYSVRLDGFGTFRVSFSSSGVATKAEVTANNITDLRIIFDADDAIKERIQKTKVTPAE